MNRDIAVITAQLTDAVAQGNWSTIDLIAVVARFAAGEAAGDRKVLERLEDHLDDAVAEEYRARTARSGSPIAWVA